MFHRLSDPHCSWGHSSVTRAGTGSGRSVNPPPSRAYVRSSSRGSETGHEYTQTLDDPVVVLNPGLDLVVEERNAINRQGIEDIF